MFWKCVGCGKFMGYEEMKKGRHHFEPSSHFGPEKSEWECSKCVEKEKTSEARTN
jgi:hypothetical protein